jgi:hypothetical protein
METVMDNDDVLLLAGQIVGLASKTTTAELEACALDADLTPANRRLVVAVASFRRLLGVEFFGEKP